MPISASLRDSSMRSIPAVSIMALTPDPWVISRRCPISPNPVTSVQACTLYFTIMSLAVLLRVVITPSTYFSPSSEASPAFAAVVSIPIPSGFVNISSSPSFAPLLVSILSGWTNPVTAIPYLGSSSKMECPPVIRAPASYTFSYPPLSISCTASLSISAGTAIIFNASLGSPPMAYTSDIALAAAICPKV